MSYIDWMVLFGTLLFIVIYGVWKTRGSKNVEGYFLGDKSMPWWTIGLSVMATQASAITFLSTPGQAYEDGMGFIQFYFGLPIAMVVLSVTVIPIFYKLKVFTAYEYLESRFDVKVRSLAAFLFLVQRGLAAGITIYAPAIVLSSILNWSLTYTNLLIGFLVIIYTVSGGTKAVSQTQKQQMAVMMGGMLIALGVIIYLLSAQITFGDALQVAGKTGKFNLVDFSFDPNNRYNLWSGLIGGFFLALSYFGTDQSQVARYLGGKSITESRMGLLFNGLLKIPMQFLILFIGAMVFVFYQFYQPPLFFNEAGKEKVIQSNYAGDWEQLEQEFGQNFEKKREKTTLMIEAFRQENEEVGRVHQRELQEMLSHEKNLRKQAKEILEKADPDAETKDTDYIFITFVMKYLPTGLVGLLLAVIFSAAMSSTSSELNALASTSTMDIYKRSIHKTGDDQHYLRASKLSTLFWGLIAIGFATFAALLDNLIQAVNILGSLFYGTILGIFLVAFYFKYIRSNAVFIAALIAEAVVIYLFMTTEIGFLWFNLIGCFIVITLGYIFQFFVDNLKKDVS